MKRLLLISTIACVMAVIPPSLGRSDEVKSAKKRPFFIEEAGIELGAVVSRERVGNAFQTIASTPFSLTRYFSDSFDIRAEASFNYVSPPGDDSFSILAAPGFNYWIDNTTSLTPFVRFGYEYIGATRASVGVAGLDLLLEKTIPLSPNLPYYSQDYIIAGLRGGAVTRRELTKVSAKRFASSYAFGDAIVSYDVPLAYDKDANRYIRAKFTAAGELLSGYGRPFDQLFTGIISLRNIDLKTGKFVNKIEMSAASDFDDYYRVTIGFSRGF